MNTKLGQNIIAIGTLDAVLEVFILVLVMFLAGSSTRMPDLSTGAVLISLFALFGLAFGLTKLKKKGRKFGFLDIETLFVFIIFILFLFLGIGEYAHAGAIAALLSGIALKTFIPEKRLQRIESEVKTMCYGFFAPLFFLSVGSAVIIPYLTSYPLFILLVVVVSAGAKLLGSYIVGVKELGIKKSVLLGIGLSVRFSTSIIVIKVLFENGLIGTGLYSVIVASSVVFTFLIPLVFSNLLVKWHLAKSS